MSRGGCGGTMSRGGSGGAKSGKGSQGRGDKGTRLKTARGRGESSTRWLRRQLADPYVAEARRQGYRSRSAFKLMELDDRFGFLKSGARIIDLGAAPGGWSQVAIERTGQGGHVVAIDLQTMDPLDGAIVLHGDMETVDSIASLVEALDGPADVVLSDMAAPATGHAATDHVRVVALAESAAELAIEILAPGGTFVAKVFQGGTERELLARLKRDFTSVRHAKPPASRNASAEVYVVALGFRGARDDDNADPRDDERSGEP
jgi:23S rRNA (uridine2552-2'-O)-methyltransferase